MHAWEMEAYPIGDCRMPHHLFPPKMLNPDQVTQMAGVIYYRVDLDDTNAMKKRLSRVKSEFNMINQDIFTMDDKMIDFTQKVVFGCTGMGGRGVVVVGRSAVFPVGDRYDSSRENTQNKSH